MQSTRYRRLTAVVLALALAVTGCSSKDKKAETMPSLPPSGQPTADPGNGPIGVTPDGVTTRVNVPAQSTEEQYAQACLAAKEWMSGKGGDPQSLVEPYLKEIQTSPEAGRATFGKTWPELTDPQRAGVIIAVNAAAAGGC